MQLKSVGQLVVRRVLPAVVALGGLVVVIAWLAGAFEPKIAPGETPTAMPLPEGWQFEQVHEVTKDYYEEAIGTLKAASRTIVSAKVLATIEEMLVTAGQQVDEGELLVRLESDEWQARLQQAERSLEAARATRVDAEAEFQRAERLRNTEPGAISQDEFDAKKARFEVARADAARAEQAVAEAEVLLSYATITAPKSGRIVDRLAEPGDTIQPGQPLLVLYDATSLRLEAPVVESLAVGLSVGDKLDVHIDALGRNVEARIDEIVPQAEAPSRSFLVKAALPLQEGLYEGMFGRLIIPAGQRRHLCLATDAIQNVGQLQFVEVVRPDNTLQRRFIKTGRLGMPGRVEVLSGLEAGERVVVKRARSARPPAEGS